ncbi:MAG TPA: amidohydrolase family protein [Gemmatimonadota bacterium]|nr:amidohydrolase family protein [Gemmatimonadota bacterium]
MIAGAVVVLALAAAPASSAPDRSIAAGAFAITHVAVIPMDAERVLEDHTVIVRDGRIVALGPAASLPAPADAIEIDGRGKWLIPGLIDMHMHLLSDDRIAEDHAPAELAVIVANGITTGRIPIGRPGHLDLRERIADGRLVGPSLWVAGPQIAGRSFGAIFNGRAATNVDEARAAVREIASSGYDFVKLTFLISREVFDAVVQTADEVGLRVIGHVGPEVGLERALESGMQIEHLDEYLEALVPDAAPVTGGISGFGVWRPEGWASLDHAVESRLPALARAVAEAGAWSTPTQHFLVTAFGDRQQSDAEILGSPDARFVSPEVRDELLRGHYQFWANPPSEERRRRFVALRRAVIRALADAGAPIMAGSDSPEWMLLYGFTLHRELEALVAAGLSPWEALAAATVTPARWLADGEPDFGTIEAGKRADLVLLDADPLAAIDNTRRIAGVMLRGEWMDAAMLEDMLDASAEELGRAPLRPEMKEGR